MSMTFVSGRQRPEPSQQTVQSVSGKIVQFLLCLRLNLIIFGIGFVNVSSTTDDSLFKFISASLYQLKLNENFARAMLFEGPFTTPTTQ